MPGHVQGFGFRVFAPLWRSGTLDRRKSNNIAYSFGNFRKKTHRNLILIFRPRITIKKLLSADLGGRVGWSPKAERVKTLFLSPLQPQTRGGGGGGGG